LAFASQVIVQLMIADILKFTGTVRLLRFTCPVLRAAAYQSATLDPAVITGDPVLAERLIVNLVDNAAKYNHPGGDIWITTQTVAGGSEVTVTNTGRSSARLTPPHLPAIRAAQRPHFRRRLRARPGHRRLHRRDPRRHRHRDNGGLTVTVTIPRAGVPARDTGIQVTERTGVSRPGWRACPPRGCQD
jgi:antitoxin (DNA-binding transcriptional repressor) of toxin-antitoxin stability system